MLSQIPKKHHYIPQGYLKAWAVSDHKLTEFRRRPKGLIGKPVSAEGTGFLEDLYTFLNVPPDLRYVLETRFFMRLDQEANDALNAYRSYAVSPTALDRFKLARFILSLVHRNPEKIAYLKNEWGETYTAIDPYLEKNYENLKKKSDPPTYEEARKLFDPNAEGRVPSD